MASGSECEENKFIKLSEDIYSTPKTDTSFRTYLSFTSDSESDESEFLKFSDRIRNTPMLEKRQCDREEKTSEVLQEICIPKIQSLNFDTSSESESDEDEFLKFSERIRNTPCSNIKTNKKTIKQSVENSNLNRIQRLQKFRKSVTKNKENHQESSDSDSDDFFTPKKLPKTPKSQIGYSKKDSSLKNFEEPNAFSEKVNEAQEFCKSGCVSATQFQNQKEYVALFPPEAVNLSYLKDPALHARKLYEFFNRKIFNSQLPNDMRLEWDGSLLKTAGLMRGLKSKNIYSCSIKLSKKLLTSFDRMQDTLLHEMCHAAVWMINHRNESHGPLWKIWASRCKLILPFVNCPERCHNYTVSYQVWYQCPSCKAKIGRCKQVKKLQNSICKKCKVPVVVMTN